MPKGKMTIAYLIRVMRANGLLEDSQVKEVQDRAGEVERKFLGDRKMRRQGGAMNTVEIIGSLKLPKPGGREDQVVEEADIMRAVAKDVGMPYRRLDPLELELEVVTKTLPRSFALKHLTIPVEIKGDRLEIAICDPFYTEVLEDVRRVTEYHLVPVLSTKQDIRRLISEFYGFMSSIEGAEGQMGGPSVDFNNLEQFFRLKGADEITASDQHIKNAVDYLFVYAFEQRASDIHLEPKRNEALVRMRIDGVLHNIHHVPKVIHPAMVSRIKMMSRLDIAEKRRPQDGRIKIDHQGNEAEIRVSTIPVAFGEKVVMRILDPDVLFRDIGDLVMNPKDLERYLEFIDRPHGIILVTGPTGSGKSTTLYSSLRQLAGEEINITTVEDPIEMIHDDFNQIAVQPQAGITFGSILRHILRQDPDIIMIGEMRDFETAENAIQAALTGHLVLSTLHTNDAPTAVGRLIDLGVERFLVASTLVGVMAQRLLRRICRYCSEEFQLSPEEVKGLGLRIKANGPVKLRRGRGCDRCRGTGYLGRMATIEVMPISNSIRQLTMDGAPATDIKSAALKDGMITLRRNAVRLMLRGMTTYQEVLRVTVED